MWAIVHGVTELDTTERLHFLSFFLYSESTPPHTIHGIIKTKGSNGVQRLSGVEGWPASTPFAATWACVPRGLFQPVRPSLLAHLWWSCCWCR